MRSRFKHLATTHLTLSVPADLKDTLEVIAAERDMSTSAFCRELFRKEIAKHEVLPNSRPGNRGSD
jgi:hypothetical protein